MLRNQKKPIRILNRTNYFDPSSTRTNITVSSPFSYQSRQQKIEGYETRLYYQFLWCRDNDGQTFFYTLTYNDKSIPHIYGMNCFDYEDLRDLLTGGFRKVLLRKYGTRFKYFIGAELGDGKGSRGFHNNPHYHILFFLEPANDPKYPYIKISPQEFRHLIRHYWQGFDESTDGWKSYSQAKYGIAREGDNCGLVYDFRACMYVAKYVCKDAKFKSQESRIRSLVWKHLEDKYSRSEEFWKEFFDFSLRPVFDTDSSLSRQEFILYHFPFSSVPSDIPYLRPYCELFLNTFHLWDLLLKFKVQYYEPYIQQEILTYRNRYCNKARISQGTGLYALDFIRSTSSPRIPVPSKKGPKYRPLCLYYYRKLFCDVIKDPNTGNNIYILNSRGHDYKMSKLDSCLSNIESEASRNLELLFQCPTLFELMKNSDVSPGLKMSWSLLKKNLQEIDIPILCRRYAEFKFIYSGRFYKLSSPPEINPTSDYSRFLVPTFSPDLFDPLGAKSFLDSHSQYQSYEKHPYFAPYRRFFAVLDLCSDYFFIQKDDRNQKRAEEIQETKRYHIVNDLSVQYVSSPSQQFFIVSQ